MEVFKRYLIRIMKLGFIIAMLIIMGETASSQGFSKSIEFPYRISRNITYLEIGSWEAKLDIYTRQNTEKPQPTLIWIHGGNSMRGSKDWSLFRLLPYLEKGFNVINIAHRLPGLTKAPSALQNCQCAIKWVYQNAAEYNIDTTKLIVSGASSGGWFAVTAAMTPRSDDWDKPCPGPEQPSIAAVVNWFGNWDLADVLEGSNAKPYAAGWIPKYSNPKEVARILSPLPLDDRAVPTVSIHGDADGVVPYSQSVRLHEALRAKGIPEQFITIPKGGHGGFSRGENEKAFNVIWNFLDQLNLLPE